MPYGSSRYGIASPKTITKYYYVNHMAPTHQRSAVWAAMAATSHVDIEVLAHHRPARFEGGIHRAANGLLFRQAWALVSAVCAAVSTIRLLPRLWRAPTSDAVIVCNGGVESFMLLAVLRLQRRALVVDYVDFMPMLAGLSWVARVRGRLECGCAMLASASIFVSEEQRQRAVASGMVRADRSFWIPYGITDKAVADARHVAQTGGHHSGAAAPGAFRAPGRGRPVRLGWFGSLFVFEGVEANGMASVLRGVARARNEAECDLQVVLGGVSKTDLGMVLEPEDNLYEYTQCTGPFSWGSIEHWQLLASCDVLLLPAGPSLVEANRAKVYDYMAAGRPIIARFTEEMQRVLGECAVYVDGSPEGWYFALLQMLADKPFREGLGECARLRLEARFVASRLAVSLDHLGELLEGGRADGQA